MVEGDPIDELRDHRRDAFRAQHGPGGVVDVVRARQQQLCAAASHSRCLCRYRDGFQHFEWHRIVTGLVRCDQARELSKVVVRDQVIVDKPPLE